MKRAQKGPTAPTLAVTKLQLRDDEDWYTPKVLKISPLRIRATAGEKQRGRMSCLIEESEWERRYVEVFLMFEDETIKNGTVQMNFYSDVRNEFGQGVVGSFNGERLDRLIGVLTAARDEAERQGLLRQRPTPTSVEEALAAAD